MTTKTCHRGFIAFLAAVIISLALLLHFVRTAAAQSDEPSFALVEDQEFIYQLADLRRDGLTVALINLTAAPFNTVLSLSDPFTEEGKHLASDSPTLASSEFELPPLSTSYHRLPLEIATEVPPGKYSALLVADDGQGTVVQARVTIFSSHPVFPWPAAAVLGGVAASYALTKYREHRPKRLLGDHRDLVYKTVSNDFEAFNEEHNGMPYVGFSIVHGVRRKLDALKMPIDQGRLEDARTELAAVEELFDRFRVFRRDKAIRLFDQYRELEGLVKSEGDRKAPQFLENLLVDLKGDAIEDSDHLDAWESRLIQWPSFLSVWKAVYIQLLDAEGYLKALANSEWRKEEHQEDYTRCGKEIAGLRGYLWACTTAEALSTYDVTSMAHDCWSILYRLWIDYNQPSIPERHPPAGLEAFAGLEASLRIEMPEWLHNALEKIGRRIFEWSAVSLALFSTFLAGLLAVYFADEAINSFGATQDYLAAVIWGFGIDRTVSGLKGVLEELGIASAAEG